MIPVTIQFFLTPFPGLSAPLFTTVMFESIGSLASQEKKVWENGMEGGGSAGLEPVAVIY